MNKQLPYLNFEKWLTHYYNLNLSILNPKKYTTQYLADLYLIKLRESKLLSPNAPFSYYSKIAFKNVLLKIYEQEFTLHLNNFIKMEKYINDHSKTHKI